MQRPIYTLCLLAMVLGTMAGFGPSLLLRAGEEPSPVRTPADERATFQLEPGLQIDLVAAEPMIKDPVAITFDADGRLWVVEMTGYMTTIDGANEDQPSGRVLVLEDTDNDGQMDQRHVYLDSLVMPRAMALVNGGVLVAEAGKLWLTKDLNNDLKADSKTLVDATYAAGGLPEHAPNGLWRGLDNWLYSAKSRVRYRSQPNGTFLRDSTEFRGQWGISHDDAGHLVYNYNWSQLHADLVPPNALTRNKNHKPTTGIDHGLTLDRRVYPIRSTLAVNRGYIPGTLDSAGRIREFTAACSPFVYRETTLPTVYRGNIFVCEPAGNLIKRNVVTQRGVTLSAQDPHPGREFLASTDERFRPVALATGPDGALYVADMYRGMVQHHAYMTPYLREKTLERNLTQPVHTGRIWRIRPKSQTSRTTKKLSTASTAELVAALSSASGWQRDIAQRLLIEQQDVQSVAALMTLVRQGHEPLGRMHALWTLDGLPKNPAPADWTDLLFGALADSDTRVSTTALRLLEPMARRDKTVQTRLGAVLRTSGPTASLPSVLQMILSASALNPADAQLLLADGMDRYDTLALLRDAALSSLAHQEFAFLKRVWTDPRWQAKQPGKEIFLEMLASAIIHERNPAQLTALFQLVGGDQKPMGWRQEAVLNGLAFGGSNTAKPIQLSAPPALLTSAALAKSPKLAAVSNFFAWPGRTVARHKTVQKPLLNEDEQKLFASGRQLYLNTCSGCHGTDGAGQSRFGPPLAGSDWVTGNEKRLALILLHGMEGPVMVKDRLYDAPDILPSMPAHSTLDDATLTALVTYIRNEWGNQAGPVDKRMVGTTRVTGQGRIVPWTAKELDAYMSKQSQPTQTQP